MTTDRMMDRVARAGIEEAIRFLQPGRSHEVSVDDHELVIVRLADTQTPYLVACRTCAKFCGEHDLRRVYPAIYRHTEAPCPTK